MDLNASIGSISENDMESDINITHSSENDDDESSAAASSSALTGQPARQRAALSSTNSNPRDHNPSESSENDYDEENGEMDPLARMLATPTRDDSEDPDSKKLRLGFDKEGPSDSEVEGPLKNSQPQDDDLVMPKTSSPSKESEREKELERRLEAKSKREAEEEEREKMQVLVSNFTEEQLDRYEMYRRSAFPKAAIKRVNTIY